VAATAIAKTAFTPIAIIEKPKPVSALIPWYFFLSLNYFGGVALRLDWIWKQWSQIECFFEGTADTLPSRKSSSSTDSCVSAHSRSGSESAGGGVNKWDQLFSYCRREREWEWVSDGEGKKEKENTVLVNLSLLNWCLLGHRYPMIKKIFVHFCITNFWFSRFRITNKFYVYIQEMWKKI